MTITSHRLFGSTTPFQAAVCPASARAATKAARPAPEMPASLWRHTQNEDAAETRHHLLAGQLVTGIAALGAGGVACALYQACTLMTGSRLHDAVAAFLR